ncbi:pyridoxamine 5'-phosphate oxidase family protein [Acidithrix ferrooxidans]|uniref:Pyridoxamine 5'-phosphate oxidase n=1 Tax=Acidithrix ferrooxidans TaxID=1280514 RepID=A0A0D8HIC7_9ACTN|nr:pyridoxamine 5'-phosphate oxidase family protein [Acidithrix ferrooxidans]KJF17683.1 pyridoxamine 5'-phosphate oxidase [Acidithrix ferrooxidans]
MATRRDLIKMTEDELAAFLHLPSSMSVATHSPSNAIHLVAMWYGFYGDDLAFWTYSKSQKVKNLERNSSITCLVESGNSYDQLRGVEIVGTCEIVRDLEVVRSIGNSVFSRYYPEADPAASLVFLSSAPKRVGVIIKATKMVSWDHSKLAGAY